MGRVPSRDGRVPSRDGRVRVDVEKYSVENPRDDSRHAKTLLDEDTTKIS